ncbi:hypothetical protein AAFF_G00034030 [Aldrovandia affinis]|uniref:Uncharacterized protein n=1 Tax=Aldrovandia affinis TaxID=143900 RepID=A0AAD7R2D8_9TELE|nr:hypothetical protein AAFF_G00034030 [Aldrovandia affinis]
MLQVSGVHDVTCHQVQLLRNAGDEVTITVQFLREAPSFLKLPLGKRPGREVRGGPLIGQILVLLLFLVEPQSSISIMELSTSASL